MPRKPPSKTPAALDAEQAELDLADARLRLDRIAGARMKLLALQAELRTLKAQVKAKRRQVQEAEWDLSFAETGSLNLAK